MLNKVLISGVCGTVGIELTKYFLDKNFEVIGVDINENELVIVEKKFNNKNLTLLPFDIYSDYMLNMLNDIEPSVIIHSAVLKNTKYNEIYKEYYHNINVNYATKFISNVLNSDYVDRFIFLSSDEAYSPVNSFGKDKLELEKILSNINAPDKIIQSIRFPFILESKGSVFHIFRSQATKNIPLTVTHKNIKKKAASMDDFINLWDIFYSSNHTNGVFNFDIGRDISIYQLAKDIIKETNSKSEILITGLREGEILDRTITKTKEVKVLDNIFKLV